MPVMAGDHRVCDGKLPPLCGVLVKQPVVCGNWQMGPGDGDRLTQAIHLTGLSLSSLLLRRSVSEKRM